MARIGGEERQLTEMNQVWRDESRLASPETVPLTRARASRSTAWVMRPSGFVPGRRYPALLSIHGGPHGPVRPRVLRRSSRCTAGAGYAVIYANPRGSHGVWREAFTQAVVGDWGGGDYADVMAVLDEALRRYPFIDPDRLGILGGSYGGFLDELDRGGTLDRFKAACSERAVNCQYTMFGTERHRLELQRGRARRRDAVGRSWRATSSARPSRTPRTS